MKQIASVQNPLVKEFVSAGKKPEAGRFLIEGPNLLEAAVAARAVLHAVFVTDKFLNREKERPSGAASERVLEKAFLVSQEVMKKAAATATPQGIAAIAGMRPLRLKDTTIPEKKNALISVSDGIKEPGNLGALIRCSDAAGASACVILHGSSNPYSPKALRASAGSLFNIPVVEADTEEFLLWLKSKAITLIGADASGEKGLYDADLTAPSAIAFGEEAHGLSPAVKRAAAYLLRIPIAGRAESLNVAASSAVILFEALRQRAKVGAGGGGLQPLQF